MTSLRGLKRRGKIVLTTAFVALVAAPLAGQSVTTRQAALRAAFLYNFAKFTEWPGRSGPELYICAMGSPDTEEKLSAIVGRSAQGRTVRAASVTTLKEASACHIVFIGLDAEEQMALPESMAIRGVLTVGESAYFVENGGMIRLRLWRNRLRLEINLQAVEKAGLRMSSQVLALSTIVEPGAGPSSPWEK